MYSLSDTATVGFDYLGNNPFKLLSFSGALSGKSVWLLWSAFNEQAVQTYAMQRSEDSVQFVDVGSVPSLSTAGPNSYNFQDSMPFVNSNGVIWYRLRIINASQSSFYGPTIRVNLKSPLKIYPNPSNGYLIVEYPFTTSSSIISILDLSGRVALVVHNNPNSSQAVLNLTGLSRGIYFVKWTDGKNAYIQGFFMN